MEDNHNPAIDESREEIRQLVEEVANTPLIQTRDFPKVDLYMEQVISFFDQELRAFARDPDDKIFTNTMINNYAKAGILPRPDKKRYNRRHLITLTYIFLLKQVLSIQDIGDFFKLMGNTDQQELEAFYEIYQELVDDYREAYVIANAHRQERIISKLKEHGLDDEKYEKLMMLSIMSMEATAHKMVCTRLLDASKASDDVKK